MDWAAAAQGLRDSRKEDVRKRQEMAKAFAEFKAANPYASAAEFQDFIDRYSGGRNYIAGGAPSGSILRAIGMDNQKRKASDEMRQRLADIQTRQQTISSLQTLADEALLGMEGDDFATTRDNFIGQFGPDGGAMLGDFNVNGMFTPTRRNMVTGRIMREYLPGAMEIIRSSDGKISSADLSKAFPGIPKAVLDPLVAEAKRVHETETAETQRRTALERANTEATIRSGVLSNPNFQAAVRAGDKAAAQRIIDATVKPYAGVYGADTFGADFSASIIDEQIQAAEAIQLTEHQKLYTDAQGKQVEAVAKLEEEALSTVNRAFRASENGTPSVLTGQAGPNGLLAAQYLSRMFDTSKPEAIDALSGLFALDESKGKTVEQLITEGAQALTVSGVSSMAFAKQQATMARGANIPEMKSFPAWRSETVSDIQADFSAMDTEIRRVSSITDPEQVKSEVARLSSQVDMLRKLHLGAIQDARVNQNIWIPVGEEGWNDGQVYGKQNSVVSLMDAEIAKLNEKLNLLSTKALEDAQAATTTPPPPPTPEVTPAPAGAQTGFQRFTTGIGDDMEATRRLNRAASDLAMGRTSLPGSSPMSNLIDFFTTSTDDPAALEQQQLKAETLTQFLREPEAKQYLLENPQTMDLLSKDPVAWAEQAYAELERRRAAQ